MEPAEIRRQVDLLGAGGWGGAFIHSRIGLTTPYLGEQWFVAVDAAVERSRQTGLRVWLYDEDKWPSGYSGGSVPLADERFRMKALLARPAGANPPAGARAIGGAVDGLQMYEWTSPLGYDWFNGTCYSDLLDADTVRRFINDAYVPYHQRYGRDYGHLVQAQFTDEPCPLFIRRLPEGCVPYTSSLFEAFRKRWGYDPVPHLHLLFRGDAHDSARFRLHYFRTVNDLFERNFSQQIGQWCEAHGIELTGHYLIEGNLYEQQAWGAKIMPNYRHYAIPGIDHLGRQVVERITAKQCHSVVNQFGKRRMMSELYGAAGGGMSFEDRWWMACQQLALGVNLLVPHLALYTMAGCRKRDYPQNMFYQQPWWPLNRVIDEPLSRLCAALSQGTYHAEVLLIHPQESTFVLWQAKSDPTSSSGLIAHDEQPTCGESKRAIDRLDRDVKSVMNAILGAQRTFDFADETILAEQGSVTNDESRLAIRVGQMRYPIVVLPSMETIAPSTVSLLQAFGAAGGAVVRCGRAPHWLDGEPSDELDRWMQTIPSVSLAELASYLHDRLPPAVDVIRWNHGRRDQLLAHVRDIGPRERLVFLTNLDRIETANATFRFRSPFRSAVRLDPTNGRSQPLPVNADADGFTVDLSLAPTQSHLLWLRDTPPRIRSVSMSPAAQRVYDLSDAAWRVTRLDENALTLDRATWQTTGSPSARAMPVIAVQQRLNELKYRGPLTLRYPLRVKSLSRGRQVRLVVEHPERYVIRVNDQVVQYEGLPAWRDLRWLSIDISCLLHAGDNTIELHCPHFQPGDLTETKDQFARYGTEIESIYVIGDFSVLADPLPDKPLSPTWQEWNLPPVSVQCFGPTFALTDPQSLERGDTTTQGLPFYAGRLELSTALPPIPPGNRCSLAVERLDGAVAAVSVGGQAVGHLVSHPLAVDFRIPRNTKPIDLSITLYGTLRNLLGPHHHVGGELPYVGPEHFGSLFDPPDAASDWLTRWTEHEIAPRDWSDRYCMSGFGDLGRIRLLIEST